MTRALLLPCACQAALWLGACAIPADDAVAGIGAPCEVSAGLCPLDLVCVPDEPGADSGVCAPLLSYGACGDPEKLPGRMGTVEEAVTLDEGADKSAIEGVRLVEGELRVHSRVREVDLGDACAFKALQRVGDTFVFGNTDVSSLDGLQGLTSVKNGIAIFGNGELASLEGLESLVEIEPCTAGTVSLQLAIVRNDRLPASEIERFVGVLEERFGKAPQVVHCENGPSGDEDDACGPADTAIAVALQDGEEFCE